MEGSLVAYKVFTNGSTLQASELNENLMQQSIAVFSNAAARTAAITSPVEGQMTYLEDTDQYASWNGSSWVSPFGMTFLNRTSFSAATSVSVNNVFSSSYDNYKVLLRITGSSVDGSDVSIRTRSSGTDFSSNVYRRALIYYGLTNSAAITSGVNLTSTASVIASSSDVLGAASEINIFEPFLTARTALKASSLGAVVFESSTIINATNSFDGFTIYPASGNITGNIRVYGLRN
jgi:hypothetical protein